jgi:hypothetical protein
MPLTFPSHQGLILPLWRRFPRRIDAVALCVGAAMPDVLDALTWPFRGELGQWLGHSLVGVIVSVPIGIALSRLARRVVPSSFIARLDEGASPDGSFPRECLSIGIGSLSHIAFDLPTHAKFMLLWPFHVPEGVFPSWWCRQWGTINLPTYRDPYPLAPHTVAWVILSAIGAALFIRCLRARHP